MFSSNSIIWGSSDISRCQHVSRHHVSTKLSVNQAWGMLNVAPVVAMWCGHMHITPTSIHGPPVLGSTVATFVTTASRHSLRIANLSRIITISATTHYMTTMTSLFVTWATKVGWHLAHVPKLCNTSLGCSEPFHTTVAHEARA